jgi:hypothetical protein
MLSSHFACSSSQLCVYTAALCAAWYTLALLRPAYCVPSTVTRRLLSEPTHRYRMPSEITPCTAHLLDVKRPPTCSTASQDTAASGASGGAQQGSCPTRKSKRRTACRQCTPAQMCILAGHTSNAALLDCVLGTQPALIQLVPRLPERHNEALLSAGRLDCRHMNTVTGGSTSLKDLWLNSRKVCSTIVEDGEYQTEWCLPHTANPGEWKVSAVIATCQGTNLEGTIDGLKVLESAPHRVCDLQPITFATGDVSTVARHESPTEGVSISTTGVVVRTFRREDNVVLVCLCGALSLHVAAPDEIECLNDRNEAFDVVPHVTPHVSWVSMQVCVGRTVCIPPGFWHTYCADALGSLCVGWLVRPARLHANVCAPGEPPAT